MKKIAKLILIVTMFASIAAAGEGHTGGGNRCETCVPPACTENCATNYDVVSEPGTAAQEGEESGESILDYFTDFIFEIFG